MFGDLELEFAGFAGEGVIVVVWVGCLDKVNGLWLLLGGGSGFSAGGWTCLDGCSDADGWGFFGVWVGGEC